MVRAWTLESYEDRKSSAMVGIYEGLVKDQYHPYVRPQESGNKTDVRWATFSNAKKTKGIKVRFENTLLSVGALPYTWDATIPIIRKTSRKLRIVKGGWKYLCAYRSQTNGCCWNR